MNIRSRIELYIDTDGKWRWRRKAANFIITGASSQGYVERADCIRNLEQERGASFYADRLRGERNYVKGKRRIGTLNRSDGQQTVVVELAGSVRK